MSPGDNLWKVVDRHFYLGYCSQKEKEFLLANVYNYVIPHFLIIWKILKNPPVGRPIVAGYKWIFTPASIFVGHFLKRFYSKFDSILNDSLSLVKLLGKSRFKKICFLFTIDFKKYIYKHSSWRCYQQYQEIMFWLSGHHSQCSFHHWTTGSGSKQ